MKNKSNDSGQRAAANGRRSAARGRAGSVRRRAFPYALCNRVLLVILLFFLFMGVCCYCTLRTGRALRYETEMRLQNNVDNVVENGR